MVRELLVQENLMVQENIIGPQTSMFSTPWFHVELVIAVGILLTTIQYEPCPIHTQIL